MMPTLRTTQATLLLLALPAAAQAQQSLFPQAAVMGGIEARQYSFGDEFGIDHVRQIAFPIAVGIPLGKRASLDIGTYYATTSVKTGASDESFSGLTDTQLKLSYVFGSDAVVASVMVNLPTGEETTTQRKFATGSSASSAFLLFPVNSYGTGTSVTPGLAAATTVGSWSLGIAASVRWSAEYQPFSDSETEGVRYQPGLETRIRLGADRLLGRSRFTIGGTYSTFASDDFSGNGLGNATYDPGNRFLVDASLLTPVANGSVSFYAWNYHRSTSSSSNEESTAGLKENILGVGAAGSFPIGGRASLEPVADGRFWSPESGSGTLFGVGTGLKLQLSPAFALVPAARVDFGSIKSTDDADSSSISGWGLSTLFRLSF